MGRTSNLRERNLRHRRLPRTATATLGFHGLRQGQSGCADYVRHVVLLPPLRQPPRSTRVVVDVTIWLINAVVLTLALIHLELHHCQVHAVLAVDFTLRTG